PMLAALAWRFVRARAAARAARRLARALGAHVAPTPRVRIQLSVASWALAFGLTAGFYLLQTDSERLTAGRWPLVSPWLHTSALSVFAVLSVLVALVYGAVSGWLADYERLPAGTAAAPHSLLRRRPTRMSPTPGTPDESDPPRRLFGLAFESRPPPVTA